MVDLGRRLEDRTFGETFRNGFRDVLSGSRTNKAGEYSGKLLVRILPSFIQKYFINKAQTYLDKHEAEDNIRYTNYKHVISK